MKNQREIQEMNDTIYAAVGLLGVVFGIISIVVSFIYIRMQYIKLEKILSLSASDLKLGDYHIDETLDAKLYQSVSDLYRSLIIEYRQADVEKESVKAYIADLSHQMKTPLANIRLYSDLLFEEVLSENERTDCQVKMRSELKKLEWLLASLTKITRLEAGAINFQIDRRLLNDTIEGAVNSVTELAGERNICIVLKPLEEEIYTMHNRKWTQEAIVNILENAIKYSHEYSHINISVDIMELYIRINIADSGIGIEKGDYNNIFKRFYRGKNVSDKQGSGLGLYLAQLIMNKQNGYIAVKSELNKGSTFSLYLKN